MTTEGNRYGLFEDSVFSLVAAQELTSPIALMRQLSLAISAEGISERERQLLGQQLTLTSERALRLASSLDMTSASQISLQLEPVNPINVCSEVIHELTPLFRAHGQTISLDSRARSPLSVANRQILRRILLAFGDNAIHYGSTEHPIRMNISVADKHVRIGMRDWGPAVPIDIWKRLESRVMSRAKSPLGNRPQISSLSLLASRHLAELMGGAVGIIRHRDGATFYVDLNVSEQMSLL